MLPVTGLCISLCVLQLLLRQQQKAGADVYIQQKCLLLGTCQVA
jgi:hypothetical protein